MPGYQGSQGGARTMWIVRLALRRPYTFVVVALLIAVLGVVSIVTVQGAAVSVPYGGKTRVVNVDLDPDALYSRGISPQEVTNAVVAQNIIVSAGTAKMGPVEYDVAANSSPAILADLNNIPLKY